MSRASIAYVLMFAALVVGMWVILRVGSRLVAPADLEGAWAVTWANESPSLPTKLTVEQSGVFATAQLGGRAYAGRLIRYAGKDTVSGVLRSRDGKSAIMLAPYDGGDEVTGSLDAPGTGAFVAYRATNRPKAVTTQPARPSLQPPR